MIIDSELSNRGGSVRSAEPEEAESLEDLFEKPLCGRRGLGRDGGVEGGDMVTSVAGAGIITGETAEGLTGIDLDRVLLLSWDEYSHILRL